MKLKNKTILEIYRELSEECKNCYSDCSKCNLFINVISPLSDKIKNQYNLAQDKDLPLQIENLDLELNYITIQDTHFPKNDIVNIIFEEKTKGSIFNIHVEFNVCGFPNNLSFYYKTYAEIQTERDRIIKNLTPPNS